MGTLDEKICSFHGNGQIYCIENIFDVDDDDNYLLTVTKEEGYQKNYKFYEGMCNCCGNHSTE